LGHPYLVSGATPNTFFMLRVSPAQWWVYNFGIETMKSYARTRAWQPRVIESSEARAGRHLFCASEIDEGEVPRNWSSSPLSTRTRYGLSLIAGPFSHDHVVRAEPEKRLCHLNQNRVRVFLYAGKGLDEVRLEQHGLAAEIKVEQANRSSEGIRQALCIFIL